MENQTNIKEPSFLERYKNLIKGCFIGFLIIVMLIPVALISDLVRERENRQQEVVDEISSKWASAQTIKGPVISVPYYYNSRNADGKIVRMMSNFCLLPEQLDINGEVLPQKRHRSLYDVTVYRSDMTLKGSFDASVVSKLNIPGENIDWTKAELHLGIDDARGLEEEVMVNWDTGSKVLEASIDGAILRGDELVTGISIAPGEKKDFNINLKLKGTGSLYFTPVGKVTSVNLNSPWNDPAFDGAYLPNDGPEINDSGFNASWKVLQVSRGYPQYWKGDNRPQFDKTAFGVKLLQPADGYAKTKRSVKYAILIISLTFVVFFFLEILQKKQVHPLQYILVGIALTVFYTLLLSISEYTGFNSAYLVAALATVTLISWYTYTIFKKFRIMAGFSVALGSIYAYIFFLIQLKDYALLFGSIGLFVILAIIMYYSRNIDWYNTSKTVEKRLHGA